MPAALRRAIQERLNDNDVLDGFVPLANLSTLFAQIDTDSSGDLTLKEVRRALTCLGLAKEGREVLVGNLLAECSFGTIQFPWSFQCPIVVSGVSRPGLTLM